MKSKYGERGAVAVEMAILLPLLLLILVGIIEYGRVLNVQISLTHAAREGARHAAIHFNDADFDDADVEDAALAAAPSLADLAVGVDHNAGACPGSRDVTVTTTIELGSLSGFLESSAFGTPGLFPIDLEGIGVMRCGG